MKWNLIGLKSDAENISFMKDFFFGMNHIDVAEFIVDDPKFSFDYKKISDCFGKKTYCIFFSADKIHENKVLYFLLGCATAVCIPSFFYSDKPFTLSLTDSKKDAAFPECFSCFSDFKKLSIEVETQVPHYLQEEARSDAYSELFNKGLPFTGDSFGAAIAKEKKDICKLYINAGMDINSTDSTGTPMLNIAVRNDSMDMIKWVLEEGADIDAVSEDRGYTAVMDAVWRKNYEATELLIKRGASLNHISKEGQSILVLAVGNGNAKICDILLKNGADSETKDMMGMSARGYANLFKNPAIVEVFEKYPAK